MARRILGCFLLVLFATYCNAIANGDDRVEVERNVEYSNPQAQHLKLDLTRPKQIEGLAPAIVCIHGGGWAFGNKESWDGVCEQFASRGYVAVSVAYRFAPKFKFPDQVNDAKAAVRWLRANATRLKIDPNRLGAVGDSAGGHLSMMLGTTGEEKEFDSGGDHPGVSSRVQCVVDFYGPADFTRSYGMSPQVDKLYRDFMGADLEHDRRGHVLASPMYWVTPDSAPMLLIHGTKDPIVSYQQAIWMRDRLKAAEVEVELLPIEGGGHGFGGDDLQRAHKAMFAFFDKHLKSDKQ
jgi:acetyl esterase/lipase